jgi:hypothetical protein
MRSATIIRQIYQAFSSRRYPGDHEIVHCDHDQRWGGPLPGPCRECAEVALHFRGKGNHALKTEGLSWLFFGLVQMSEAAFAFWLPSYLAAAIRCTRGDMEIFDGLEFAFRPPKTQKEEKWQKSRLRLLSSPELEALIAAFQHMKLQGRYTEAEYSAIVGNLSAWRRPSAS